MSTRKARRAWKAAIRRHIRRGQMYHIKIRHDADCLINSNERVCTCNPDRVILSADRKLLATVKGAGDYDPLEIAMANMEGAQ